MSDREVGWQQRFPPLALAACVMSFLLVPGSAVAQRGGKGPTTASQSKRSSGGWSHLR